MIRISPRLLSWVVIPVGLLWIASAAIHARHALAGDLAATPDFWLKMFYVAGPLAAFVASTLVTVHRCEQRRYDWFDRIALAIAIAGAGAFGGTLVLMLLRTH